MSYVIVSLGCIDLHQSKLHWEAYVNCFLVQCYCSIWNQYLHRSLCICHSASASFSSSVQLSSPCLTAWISVRTDIHHKVGPHWCTSRHGLSTDMDPVVIAGHTFLWSWNTYDDIHMYDSVKLDVWLLVSLCTVTVVISHMNQISESAFCQLDEISCVRARQNSLVSVTDLPLFLSFPLADQFAFSISLSSTRIDVSVHHHQQYHRSLLIFSSFFSPAFSPYTITVIYSWSCLVFNGPVIKLCLSLLLWSYWSSQLCSYQYGSLYSYSS